MYGFSKIEPTIVWLWSTLHFFENIRHAIQRRRPFGFEGIVTLTETHIKQILTAGRIVREVLKALADDCLFHTKVWAAYDTKWG